MVLIGILAGFAIVSFVCVCISFSCMLDEWKGTQAALEQINVGKPFVVSEYLERMEKANCEILRNREANRQDEPITLWIGLHGVRLVDGVVVWVDKYPKPQTGGGGQGGSWYPLQDPIQTLMSPIQYPVAYAAQQAIQYYDTMNYRALQNRLMSQCCSATAEQMTRALQECCCVQNKREELK